MEKHDLMNLPPWELLLKKILWKQLGDISDKRILDFGSGIGVNPNLCGKHYGRRMLALSYEISKERYPGKPLYLEVRTWNARAVKCYEKAGFQIDGEPFEMTTGIGVGTFYRMTKA